MNCTHVALQVREIVKTIRFYSRYCNMRVIHDRTDEFRVVWLGWGDPPHRFAIVLLEKPYDTHQPAPLQHIGIAVERRQDVDDIAARAQADGLDVPWPPVDAGPFAGYFCGLHDPDGNVVEFSHGQPLG
jgi:catechol 2,3-dioxygenase-like lactoylglutathione lyase family enzyme